MKRASGEGTIVKRSDGRWCAVVWLSDGLKRKRKYCYCKTQREARHALQRLQRDRDAGQIVDGSQRLDSYCKHWLEHQATRVRANTLDRYTDLLRLHILPVLGAVPLPKLTPQHVQVALDKAAASGLSPRTVLHARSVLRNALQQAVRWGLVPRNAASLSDPPRALGPGRSAALSITELRKLLAASAGTKYHALWVLLATCGLRRSEALALRWGDIDISAGTLSVSRSLVRQGGRWLVSAPKTERSDRMIELPALATEALRAHHRDQAAARLLAGPSWRQGNKDLGHLVFTTSTGSPLHGRYLLRTLHELCDKAGVQRVRVHDLRHSAATLLLSSGVQLTQVSAILGHSKTSTTSDIYSHVLREARREGADTMDALLGAQ